MENKEIAQLLIDATEDASKLYWTEFSKQLEENNYERLYDLITEVRDRFCMFVPNRHDLHTKIRENIDKDFIKRKIENAVFVGKDFVELVEYCAYLLKTFGMPAKDEYVDQWKNEIIIGLNNETKFCDVLPNFFNTLLIQIDEIEDVIKQYKEANPQIFTTV